MEPLFIPDTNRTLSSLYLIKKGNSMKKEIIFKWIISVLMSISFYACSDDDQNIITTPETDVLSLAETSIWSGSKLVFSKSAGADVTKEENQDRISDKVWITRGNDGGQIYNAVTESSANQDLSPAGTLWAKGTTANLQTLTFASFRSTLSKPKENVGVPLVMLLVEENIAIDVTFTSWAQQKLGGFSYERSTP